ncbi:glutathione S-transferase family protein [Ponticaulis sp.]|uniref:glutathione S-transferase family protein n=1 Tax=Ponticaulis sp. TaxID=2020902 RepID=UPI000B6FBF62|nr:glutathione S-transferase family protein [Ponticaulis sp.]MAJ07240.1 glutathione S-transferase [Ponticaulis sp.]MAJ07716.1 glutathione S-transferase [Ponticaulis sp.]RPG17940.1 MAG: glutathione S-transferase family protein [Hyphomonadaceae bacterium TMED125]|tara:strand:+ start:17111 stop:18436 length:1326 start_codon:yes stop_codon:yes gene_type:complete
MGAKYRLFGSETSPYSIKVRSYLRYKKLPFEWVAKGFGTEEEFQSLAKSQALPMLVSPKGGVAHDSSLILSRLEGKVYKPSARPNDPACRVLALLLEEYADEWLNKAMFHYRWGTAKAAKAAATCQADAVFEGYEVENRADIEKSIAKSMSGRLKLIGSTKKTTPVIEASFARFLKLLNAHLEKHLFLFGGHPSLADFAIAGQLIQLMKDDTSGAMIRDSAPFVTAWCEFMEDPRQGAVFEDLSAVGDTLLPLIRDEVVPTLIAWAEANAEAIAKKRKTVTVGMDVGEFKQGIQGHSATSYATLKAAFADTPATPELEAFLKDAGLTDILPLGEPAPEKQEEPAEDTQSEDAPQKPKRRRRRRGGSKSSETPEATEDTAAAEDTTSEDTPSAKAEVETEAPATEETPAVVPDAPDAEPEAAEPVADAESSGEDEPSETKDQ